MKVMRPGHILTLRDIAVQANVSIATVSMALRNHPRVSVGTRERIHALAKEMGYLPDPHVSELMGYLRKGRINNIRETIAFVSKMTLTELRATGVFWEQYVGALKRAKDLGYSVEYHVVSSHMTETRLGSILKSRGVRGILVLPQKDQFGNSKGFESLPWENFASVAIGFSCPVPQTHRVMHDQIQALHTAMNALQNLGYRRPGLVMESWLDNRLRNHWTAGFLSCQLRYYLKKDRVPPMMDPTDSPQLLSWFARWRPDVLIGPDVISVIDLLKNSGYCFPGDFAYATLDKQMEGRWSHHAGIQQISSHVGETAIELLAGCLTRNEIGLPTHPQVILLPGFWVDGETAPPRR